MWTDGNGYEHWGRPPHEDRGWKQWRNNMTIEEKYKEKIDEACRWLNDILYSDPYTPNSDVIVHPLIACKSKKEIIDDFREMMKIT